MEAALEILVIAGAAWPAARLCLTAGYRTAHPAAVRRLSALIIMWAGAGGAAALLLPAAARALAPAAAAAAASGWWRSRPTWGRRRGLPPGSFTVGPPAGAYRDDLFYLAQARCHGPIFKVGGFRAGQVCVVGLAAGLELLRGHEDARVPPPLPYSGLIPRGFLRYMSSADHDVYRRLLRPALTREVVEASAGEMAAAAHRHFERLAAASGAGAGPDDTLTALAFEVLIRIVYGLGPEDPAFARVARCYEDLDHRPGRGGGEAATRRALASLEHELRAGAPAGALAAIACLDAAAPADPTVLGNLAFIPRVAANDLGDGLLWIVYELARHPEWQARLRLAGAADDDPASRVVLETLRLHQSEYLVRRATADIAFRGFVIPRGWLVRVCVRESHRDPAVFRDPDAFDPDRFLGRSFARDEYAPFGGDRHACLGEHLTRALGRIVVNELARGWELAVTSDGPPEMGALHWRPSRRFRLRLTRRESGRR